MSNDNQPIGHNLDTSEGARAYVAEFFANQVRRHDFRAYVTTRLAADFACALAKHLAAQSAGHTFQGDVAGWMGKCFPPSLSSNMTERGDRLLEEVLELLQAHGYDSARVPTLVNYVFSRPVGEPAQEVGGVMVTLAAYCSVADLDMHAAGDAELARINQPEVMDKIRRKQEAKNALHFDNPLPGHSAPPAQAVDLGRARNSIQALLSWIDDWAETPEESGLDPIAERALEVVAQIDAQVYADEPNSETNRLTALAQPPMFYIQDTRQFVGNCPVWWGPNGGGYVTRLDEAGRYTEQEAVTQNRTRESDIPWPCAEIDALARQTVDCQHMRPRAERLAELAQVESQAVGNG